MGSLCSKQSIPLVEAPSTFEIPPDLQLGKLGLAHFTIKRTLGKGSFGKVFLVARKDTGVLYAMKVISKNRLSDQKRKAHTIAERDILSTIKSEFVVRLHYAFQTASKLFMVLDFMQGGELYFHMRQAGKFPVHVARFYAAEVLLALQDLHENGVIYRDLKPENILIDNSGHIKLADFNLAKHLSEQRPRTLCGTPEYIAPEVLKKATQTIYIDYWSLGVLIYEMVHGKSPFYSRSHQELFANILDGVYRINKKLPTDVKDIIDALLEKNPQKRGENAQNIRSFAFFREVNWDSLRQRKAVPPIRPTVKGHEDLGYFKRLNEALSPEATSALPEYYQNFTYVGSPLKYK